jgi:uncharacterized protein YjdB
MNWFWKEFFMSGTKDQKWLHRVVLLLLFACFVLSVSVSAADTVDLAGKTGITVLKGKSYNLTLSNAAELLQKVGLTGQAENGAVQTNSSTITWSSTKKSVASVTKKGKLKAKKAGTTVVIAQIGTFRYYCAVTVNKPVSSITLNKKSKTIKCGKTYTLSATVKPTSGANTAVTWSSSKTKIAKVSSKGKVTAVGIGTCTITVKATDGSGKKATCSIKVTEGDPVLSKATMTLSVGTSELLQVQNVNSTDVVWESSDNSIVTVSGDGTVTAVQEGSAVVTVRKKDGSQSVSCNVTVTATSTGASASAMALKYLALLQKYSDRVQKDYTSGSPWMYSNSGTSSTWSSAASKNHKVNCALMVRWGLRELGIIDSTNFWGDKNGEIEFKGNVKEQLLKYCDIIKVYKTPQQLLTEGNLLPGDICTWKEIRHTNVYAGNGLWYDAGRGVNYTSTGFTSFGPSASMSMTGKTVGYIIRLK